MRTTTMLKLGACLGALAIPPATAAADGGPGGLGFSDPTAPTVFADGSTLLAPTGGLLGESVTVRGTLTGTVPGDAVVVEQLDPILGWQRATTGTVAPDGSYAASWTPAHTGHLKLRVTRAGQATSAAADDGLGARPVTVYRRARATWYGPGFYGRRTACGTRLRRTTLGVAHKTLPCGTLVELYKDGRTVVAPVIDRGPFRAGTSYDLTYATAQALGVRTTTTLGAVRAAPAADSASG